jgi:uncharacterized membrane protein
MKFQFSHPEWLLALPLVWAWALWWTRQSDVQISAWRRWTALGLRGVVATLLVLALAGLQWLKPQEGVNVFFLLDRSDSIPSPQQEAARRLVNQYAEEKKRPDKAGLLVFGAEAALETTASEAVDTRSTKILAVIDTERTDIASAIRLGTAAFPETGQKRLALLSDGNENLGDAEAALAQARALGVTLDVVPLGVERGNDVSVQKLVLPGRIKEKQPFEAKVFVQADQAQQAKLRVYRNDQPLGEQTVELLPGKNLFTFPQALEEKGFYSYSVVLEAAGDRVPQNNQAAAFVTVRGEPRVLLVSSAPAQDALLASALQWAKLNVQLTSLAGFPRTLAALQDYDAVFISNLAAGDLGDANMKLLESAVRDFGVGLVCVGGDQAYAAGAYRGTPLETALPVNMELDSKKVLPQGAVALVMHGMEFGNGNQVARDCALGVLDALGPQDELGVVLWDGSERWLVPLSPVGNKREHGRSIAGMNQGDLPSFQGVMSRAYDSLKASTANLKHIIVFSDGDPAAPSPALMSDIRAARITVSTVLISGHAGPETMIWIADSGGGRFYNIQDPTQLPQVFIKEAAVILKSAIFEEPFLPQQVAGSELLKGIGAEDYPRLLGYVCTTPKARAETPLVSHKGDPLLAHWQFGLGRAVAFTSDAKARWAKDWMSWPKYRQFWTQIAQWSLRRLENADLTTEVSVEKGEGAVSVEALDDKGDYRNFLNLQAVVVSPTGDRQTVRLEQTGPGRYEARFPTKEVGSYLLNLMEIKDGKVAGAQVVGASVNYSPEFSASEPNLGLLRRLAESGGGRVLDPRLPSDNPFLHNRQKTFQPLDWWEWLLKLAVVLFTLDVAVRRIQIDRDEWLRATATLHRLVFFWKGPPRPAEADESLAALLSRRDQVRAARTVVAPEARPELFQPQPPARVPEVAAAAVAAPQREGSDAPAATPPAQPRDTSTASRLLDAKRRARRKME